MNELRTAVELAITMLKTKAPEYGFRDVLNVLENALVEPVQEPGFWVCPEAPEVLYERPGYCEDCGETLIRSR